MRPPKLSLNMALCIAEEKKRKQKAAKELPFIREGVLTGLLIDAADVFGVPLETIQKGDQQELTVFVRSIFYYVARTNTEYGLLAIAKIAGRKDHASVIHQLDKVNAFFKEKNAEFLTLWQYYLTRSKLFTSKDFPSWKAE
jgi:chromosomal replication initiation ATPase DnaA